MALKTVSQLKDSVAGLLSGMDLSNVDDLNGALQRAASVFIQKAYVPEASGTQNIVLYSGVTDYAVDTRIFGTTINDIRPQGISRSPFDVVYKKGEEDFDRTKGYVRNGTLATFRYLNGVPTIQVVSQNPLQNIVLDTMTAITGWTAAGSASLLTQDTAVFYQSPASMRFKLTGSSTGTLTKTITSSSIASYQNVGVAFLALRIPDGATASNLTSISLKLGSSVSVYSTVTATQGFLGSWVSGDWLIVAFDFSTAVDTGTPNWAAISYVQLSFAHTGTFTNIRVGGLWIAQPSPAQILYQSAAVFLPVNSTTASETISASTDSITFNTPAYTIYTYECAIAVLQNTGGSASDASITGLRQVLNGVRARNGAVIEQGLYDFYRGDNPSQVVKQTGSYYDN